MSLPLREVGSWNDGERIRLRCRLNPAYDNRMAKAKKFELESPAPVPDEEDEETLAAIDEGVRDAKAGRTVPAEEVRKRLPKWITASSTRKGR
jgi:hypothetical protein